MAKNFLVAVVVCLSGLALGSPLPALAIAPAQAGDPVLVGAGDIAYCTRSGDEATAQLLDGLDGTVFTLGDNVYPDGTLAEFTDCYEPSWGRHKARTRPAPGNHDYHTPGAAGYYTYFGAAASPQEPNCTSDCRGYYSYDLGAWHIIVLNSEIDRGAGSDQEQWLQADLAAHQNVCTLAYWHKPRFSSGQHGNSDSMQPLWEALYAYRADVVLNGHDHLYERFAPQNPSGQADPVRGIRQFVVGTGGAGLYPLSTIKANSEVRNTTTWGVLKLTLHSTSYDWEFIPVAGQTFTDAGSADCVGAGPAPTATPVATLLSLAPVADAMVRETNPQTNYGSSSRLDVDSPGEESYLRFVVSGVTGVVQRAMLRLFVTNGSSNGPALYATDPRWSESEITWQKRSSPTGNMVADLDSIAADVWAEYDLTSVITADGVYSFVLVPQGTNGVTFSSRESSSPPVLVVAFVAAPTATPITTPTPTNTPPSSLTTTPTLTNTLLSPPTGSPTATPPSAATAIPSPTPPDAATTTPTPSPNTPATETAVPNATRTETPTLSPTSATPEPGYATTHLFLPFISQ